jgi:hypothetical protein
MSLCAALARLRLTSTLRNAGVRKGILNLLSAVGDAYAGQDTYAVQIEVMGVRGTARISLLGQNESDGIAKGAELMASALLEREVAQAGVWLPEQVNEPNKFFALLADHDLHVHIDSDA